MFRGFDDDPFFRDFNEGVRRHHGGGHPADTMGNRGDIFRDMDNMMNNMMRGFRSDMAILGGEEKGNRSSDRQVAERRNSPRSFFPDMGTLQRQMDDMSRSGDGYSFSSQQFYSCHKDGNGEPQEFQAISSSAQGPGGIKETKKGYKDTSKQTQKMQYGRHIGDRATIQERSQVRDKREEKTDYIGFEEERAPEFDSEWRSKAGSLYRPSFGAGPSSNNKEIERPRARRSNKQKALPQPKDN